MAAQDNDIPMQETTDDNELLLILLRNLRNATYTFGEGTPPTESIRTSVEDHLQSMKRRGITTNLAKARTAASASGQIVAIVPEKKKPEDYDQLVDIFTKLNIRPQ